MKHRYCKGPSPSPLVSYLAGSVPHGRQQHLAAAMNNACYARPRTLHAVKLYLPFVTSSPTITFRVGCFLLVTWKPHVCRAQLKLPEATKDYLGGAEEAFKAAKEARKGELWDDKMRATQTESAFGVRAL